MPTDRGIAGPADALKIEPAASLDTAQTRRLREIYEQAFPADLRVPLADLAEPSTSDQLLVVIDNYDPVGFAAIRLLADVRWVFLRYFAVAADRQRTGIGRRVWDLLQQSVASSRWPARIVFECEDPREAASDPAEHAVRVGRISFWASCGARELAVPRYVMPALTGIGQPEAMVLMAADPDEDADPRASDLTALVRAIFTGHYGLAPTDPLVTTALDSVGHGRG